MMRWLFAGVLMFAAATGTPGTARATPCGDGNGGIGLEIRIDGVRSANGTISIAVYGDRREDFLAKGKKLRKARVPAQQGATRACIALPRSGTYAIAAYHDEDGDMHLTRNLVGIPVEGMALSNDPDVGLAIPTFEQVAVVVDGNGYIQMKMIYR